MVCLDQLESSNFALSERKLHAARAVLINHHPECNFALSVINIVIVIVRKHFASYALIRNITQERMRNLVRLLRLS